MGAQQENWNAALAGAVAAQGQAMFWEKLCLALGELVVSRPLVLLYRSQCEPEALFHHYSPREYRANVQQYLAGGIYLLDPFYQASANGEASGLYRLADVAPDRFKQTEFYRRYYQQTGIEDELSFLVSLDSGGTGIHLSLGVAEGKPRFSSAEVKRLRSVCPVVLALIEQHWRQVEPHKSATKGALHQQLSVVLDNFGSAVLTERERQVLQLVLRGHSNQSVADRLAISLPTVKLHRKNAYHKLDISSQAELFHLFVDSLSSFDPAVNKDPLASYLTRGSG